MKNKVKQLIPIKYREYYPSEFPPKYSQWTKSVGQTESPSKRARQESATVGGTAK
jgi:hypothetical protein